MDQVRRARGVGVELTEPHILCYYRYGAFCFTKIFFKEYKCQ